MHFDRWNSPWQRTWAFTIFKKHHTQLNDMWWSHHCASRRAASIAKSVGHTSPTIKAFPAAIFHESRSNLPLSEWYEHFCEFDNWVRLSSALALCSYFEIYLAKVVGLALRSDPAILLNSSKSVDGVVLLKNNKLSNFKDEITSVTKGDWSARVHAYKSIFDFVPDKLADEISELDQLRRLRNDVGHAFGRGVEDYESPLAMEVKGLQRLSEKRLKKWLGVVEKAVNSIDAHLRVAHIGAFEVFEAYHSWDKNFNMGNQSEHGAFKDIFPNTNGFPLKLTYCKDAIKYFKAI
ncbi:hypothetical protein [Burkholderia cepacia]|uniref:hypothetical protein n=1 Tax=Burkholderia cepacia TaxID=292 RepID=UPI000AE3EECF|nr:hypothetical protein [Burkholderia cepacia]